MVKSSSPNRHSLTCFCMSTCTLKPSISCSFLWTSCLKFRFSHSNVLIRVRYCFAYVFNLLTSTSCFSFSSVRESILVCRRYSLFGSMQSIRRLSSNFTFGSFGRFESMFLALASSALNSLIYCYWASDYLSWDSYIFCIWALTLITESNYCSRSLNLESASFNYSRNSWFINLKWTNSSVPLTTCISSWRRWAFIGPTEANCLAYCSNCNIW